MGAIATGTPPRKAAYKAGISQRLLTAYIRAEPSLAQHYRACVKAGRRKRWPMTVLEEALEDIALTAMTTKQACERHGLPYGGFLDLTRRDEIIGARYLNAKATQQEMLHDMLTSESGSRLDEITTRAALREHARNLNQGALAIRKLLPMRQRRAEARAFRRERVKDDPLAQARLREKLRRPI
jgi:hypothetical protein